MELAITDGLDVAGISTDENTDGHGRILFRRHGFREVGEFKVPLDGDMEEFIYTYHVFDTEESSSEKEPDDENTKESEQDASSKGKTTVGLT